MKEYLKNVTIRDLQESDRKRCEDLNFDFLLKDKSKIIEKDNLFVIVSKYDYENYGKEQLCEAVFIEHSNFFDRDFLRVDFAKIANDVNFNKPKTIEVEFVENVSGTSDSVFKNIDEPQKHYIRQDNSSEKYAKWYSASWHKDKWTDNGEIRANITFKMNDETEKVSFSNWNAEGVTSNDYNDAFSYKMLERKATISRLVELSNTYNFKAVTKDDIVTLCAKNLDGKWTDWIRYNSNDNKLEVVGNTDNCNIWLCDTRKDLTPDKIIDFVYSLNYVLSNVDIEVELKALIDPEDWQELANVKDASADPRYNDIDKEDIDKDI